VFLVSPPGSNYLKPGQALSWTLLTFWQTLSGDVETFWSNHLGLSIFLAPLARSGDLFPRFKKRRSIMRSWLGWPALRASGTRVSNPFRMTTRICCPGVRLLSPCGQLVNSLLVEFPSRQIGPSLGRCRPGERLQPFVQRLASTRTSNGVKEAAAP